MHASASETHYWDLRGKASAALLGARLGEAAQFLLDARGVARRRGQDSLADRAFCTWVAVATEGGVPLDSVGELSRILGSSPDLRARCLAAQSLNGIYRSAGRLRPAGLYAEIAVRLALAEGGSSGKLASFNRLALIRIGQGRYEEARSWLGQALEIAVAHASPEAPAVLLSSSLAYCHALDGESRSAWHLLDGLEKDRASCLPMYRTSLELNLGFTCLELEEPEAARDHARTALSAAIVPRGEDAKYAHYLLGETASQLGDVAEAQEQFHRLQQRYYPDLTSLPDLLLSIGTSSMLNWLG